LGRRAIGTRRRAFRRPQARGRARRGGPAKSPRRVHLVPSPRQRRFGRDEIASHERVLQPRRPGWV
jgi:hypothetical protein